MSKFLFKKMSQQKKSESLKDFSYKFLNLKKKKKRDLK